VNLLVTGGAGYLGAELCRRAPEALATWHRTPVAGGVQLDVRDEHAVMRCFLKRGPDVVIHTAYVLGDEETIVRGSANVALAADRTGARLVHLSTDLVFDGEQGAPYREDDEPRPVMEYGQAKLEAEKLVARAHAEALIVRTSLLYGPPDGQQEALARRDDVEFFTDEIRSPIRVGVLATALLELAVRDESGILHVAGRDAVSRADFAAALRGGPVATRPSPRVGRARNVALDSSRARALLRTPLV
jgi:dTDP-4-dehydrorhamnose reductase